MNRERHWLFGAVDPATNSIHLVGLFPRRTIETTKMFLADLAENHSIEDAEFLIDGPRGSTPRCSIVDSHSGGKCSGIANRSTDVARDQASDERLLQLV